MDEPILRSVKEEVNEEEPSQSSQLSPLEKEIESAVQSCVMIVHTQIESMTKNGRDGEMPIIITEILPIDTVPTESSEDTVERREDEDKETNDVAITEEVMDNESREEEKEGDNETVEKEEVSIETAIEEMDDNDEPPIKKMRIEQEVVHLNRRIKGER